MAQKLSLNTLQPASARRDRKRIGRGIKGQKARSGSNKMRPGFEGGQNPIYMRLGKQRGPYSKDAMPMGPHRTKVQAVNVRDLERFDGDVTPESLKEAGLIRSTRIDVKVLGHGDLTKKLTVSAHLFSKSAREKIEGAGGSITWLRGEPKPKKPKPKKERKPAAEAPTEQEEAEVAEEAAEAAEPPDSDADEPQEPEEA